MFSLDKSIQGISACLSYFAFQTVFYIQGSSYCCCRCAYDHEYFTYISDNGEIDKDKFEILAKAVECGYCEHAIGVQNKDYLRETKVYAIHVVSALGSEGMVEVIASVLNGNRRRQQIGLWPNLNRYNLFPQSGIFELTPCDVGCLKHNGKVLHLVDKVACDKNIICAEEITNSVLHFDKISLLQFCFLESFIEKPLTVLDAVNTNRIKYYCDEFAGKECKQAVKMKIPALSPVSKSMISLRYSHCL